MEVRMKKFILSPRKIKYAKHKDEAKVRISSEAYNTLVDMANSSTMPMTKIASQAIQFAFDNLVYQEEEK